MKGLLLGAAILGALFNTNAMAQPSEDGFPAGTLNTWCSIDQNTHDLSKVAQVVSCQMFLKGMVNGIFALQTWQNSGKPALCLPSHKPVDLDQARQLFIDYMAQHPELGASSAGGVASITTIGHYMCK